MGKKSYKTNVLYYSNEKARLNIIDVVISVSIMTMGLLWSVLFGVLC